MATPPLITNNFKFVPKERSAPSQKMEKDWDLQANMNVETATTNHQLSQFTLLPSPSDHSPPRKHSIHLDPLSHIGDANTERAINLPGSSFSATSTQVDDSSPPSSVFPLRVPKSFLSHREDLSTNSKHHPSIDQTLAKPNVFYHDPKSRNSSFSIAPSIAKSLNGTKGSDLRRPSMTTSQRLSVALSDLNAAQNTPPTARFNSLQSPCFFHERFDDAINIDRVLEEISEEGDSMSPCRLMQTATSVREISKQLQRRPIKRAVRNVMIVTKARDNSLVNLTRELAEWLLSTPRYGLDVGVTVYVDAKLKTSKRFDAPSLLASNPRYEQMLRYWTPDICWTSPEKFDLVLTLGGDGTVLFTSNLFQRVVPPILSFALGSLGFLTNFQYADYKTSLNNIMGDVGMRVNLRMRFTCTVFRANHDRPGKGQSNITDMVEGEQFEVLNELVIDRGPSPYVSNLELYGDNELITVVQADGCIFSTPTGSTAYSLSAGGPLTHPSIPGILLTPICPHTLSFRPMVLSDSLLLKVCVPKNSRSTAYASFDGKGRVELRRGDCVQVEAGRYPFPTVVGAAGAGGEWFESVRRALRWNTRGAVQKGFSAKTKAGPEKGSLLGDEDGKVEVEEAEEEEEDIDAEDEEWDINPDPIDMHSSADSGIGASEEDSNAASPSKKLESEFAI